MHITQFSCMVHIFFFFLSLFFLFLFLRFGLENAIPACLFCILVGENSSNNCDTTVIIAGQGGNLAVSLRLLLYLLVYTCMYTLPSSSLLPLTCFSCAYTYFCFFPILLILLPSAMINRKQPYCRHQSTPPLTIYPGLLHFSCILFLSSASFFHPSLGMSPLS